MCTSGMPRLDRKPASSYTAPEHRVTKGELGVQAPVGFWATWLRFGFQVYGASKDLTSDP